MSAAARASKALTAFVAAAPLGTGATALAGAGGWAFAYGLGLALCTATAVYLAPPNALPPPRGVGDGVVER